MKLLLDTCILIPAEPTDVTEIEHDTGVIALLQRACQENGVQTYVHPSSVKELAHDRQDQRRQARELLVQRYLVLERPPEITSELELLVGAASPDSHDEIDNKLLAALFGEAVDLLVTSDARLLRKAERAGLRNRVGTPIEILKRIQARRSRKAIPRPGIRFAHSYELNGQDAIFDPLRNEYQDFDNWFSKCKREHRPAWFIKRVDSSYGAVSIIKDEQPGGYSLPGKVLKICTFAAESGHGYGELLLKAVFDHAFLNSYDRLYLEVYPKHGDVIRLMKQFGFDDLGCESTKGERVLVKVISRTMIDRERMTPLEYNIQCGPQRVKLDGAPVFLIPIQSKFHRVLFPEADAQRDLFPGHFPFGNAIRKAYLCHANLKRVMPGALLLFYQSRRNQGIYCVGVAEKSIRSCDPQEILNFVGTRTVYSIEEIEKQCAKEVLAILFRHAVTLENEWPRTHLIEGGVIAAPPQSIVEVPQEALPWLKARLNRWL